MTRKIGPISIPSEGTLDAMAKAAFSEFSVEPWEVASGDVREKWRIAMRRALSVGSLRPKRKETLTIDMAGKTFGDWSVSEYAGRGYWACTCKCGTVAEVSGRGLRSGKSTRCKVCQMEDNPQKTHGGAKTRLFRIRGGMIARCENNNLYAYKNYGARGIYVCPEWRDSFVAFRGWALTNGYKPNLSLERKDVNGPYSPDNCCWATAKQQARNRRNSRKILYCGKEWLLADLADALGMKKETLVSRVIQRGWDTKRAVLTQVRQSNANS